MSLVAEPVVAERGVRTAKEAQSNSSDRRIAEAARERLRSSPYQALRIVRCECRHGVLTLAGRVPSFYMRQVAQAQLRDLVGVRRIEDHLQVQAT